MERELLRVEDVELDRVSKRVHTIKKPWQIHARYKNLTNNSVRSTIAAGDFFVGRSKINSRPPEIHAACVFGSDDL